MSEPRSALPGARYQGSARIEEAGLTGMITLRGDIGSGAIASAVHAATGASVPGCRRVSTGDRGTALWMSPDEVLLLVAHGTAAGLVAMIGEKLAGVHHLAVDVSDARARFRVMGAGAREVLAKGAPVDLSATAFGPGDLRRTRLGQVAVAFWCVEPQSFEILCFRSVAGFVFDWLSHAAKPGSEVGFLTPVA